ncbi:MAG: hypothetical protein EOO50_12845 [Flavobacterium sp.]|uniref:hypothetical protein n=1 Tax=Flavobacterium sp. TaxID=239 RepID=UPI0012001666|nr:hypothetical protein [Flavobacterium sp.]RZJ65691.1 MAG: hypothetical protein EOO50_12845 [Flavobacterium sp.]
MKKCVAIFLVIISALVYSCKSRQSERDRAAAAFTSCWFSTKDSIWNDYLLQDALRIYASRKDKKTLFSKKYVVAAPDSSFATNIHIFERIFSKSGRYLVVDRKCGIEYFNIYLSESEKLQPVLAHEEYLYAIDIYDFKDVNADGNEDFNLYHSESRYRPGERQTTYIMRNDGRSFSPKLKFENPTFSAQEKTVLVMDIGFSGNVPMRKLAWNGETVDTLETISLEYDADFKRTGKFVRMTTHLRNKRIEILDSLPNEYVNFSLLDRFLATDREPNPKP